MKGIKLSRNLVALVDDEDFEYLNQFKWSVNSSNNAFYAVRCVPAPEKGKYKNGKTKRKKLRMHNVILNPPKGYEIDHINNNSLDNRKSNLRIAYRGQNTCNRRAVVNTTSNFKGVSLRGIKWRAQIQIGNKKFYLGDFASEKIAAIAYNEAALRLHGIFAVLNNINEVK